MWKLTFETLLRRYRRSSPAPALIHCKEYSKGEPSVCSHRIFILLHAYAAILGGFNTIVALQLCNIKALWYSSLCYYRTAGVRYV